MFYKERSVSIYNVEGVLNKRVPDIFYGSLPPSTAIERLNIHKSGVSPEVLARYPNNVGIQMAYGLERFGSTKRGKKIYNDCDHSFNRVVSAPFTMWYRDNGTSSPRAVCGYRFDINPDMVFPFNNGVLDIPDVWWQLKTARERAWYHLQPRFDGGVQMLNFLFELKDFKDIAGSLASLHKKFPSNVKHLSLDSLRKEASKSPQSRTVNGITQLKKSKSGQLPAPRNPEWQRKTGDGIPVVDPSVAASNAWLFWSFGLQPFLRDVTDIMTQAGILASQAYDEFVAKGHEPTSRHYREILDKSYTGIKSWEGMKRGDYQSLSFNATAQYTYEYSPRDPRDVFERFWGLKWTPEVIWNMLPFSFLWDYFQRFGKALNAVQRDTNALMNLIQYCESLMLKKISGIYYTGEYSGVTGLCCYKKDWDLSQPVLLAGVDRTHYIRTKTQPVPNGLYIPKFKLPSGKQGLNMLALARLFI